MAKKISNDDLVWLVRERLVAKYAHLKNIPIAIIPSSDSWEAVTSARYRKSAGRIIEKISKELLPAYRVEP